MVDISITLLKQQIVNDVAAECNLMGRTMEASGKTEDGSSSLVELAGYIKSPDDEDTKPIVARSMCEGWDQVKECCQRFVKYGRIEDDNRLESIILNITDSINVSSNLFTNTGWNFTASGWSHSLGKVYVTKDIIHKLSWDLSDINPTGCDIDFSLYIGTMKVWTGKFNSSFSGKINLDITPSESIAEAEVTLQTVQGSSMLTLPSVTAGKTSVLTINHKEFDKYNLELSMPDSFNTGVTSSIKSYAHRLIVDTVIAAVLKNQKVDGYTKYLATAKSAKEALIRVLQARSSFMRHTSSWM